MKQCSKCHLDKVSTDFYKTKISKDGLESSCKECKSLYIKNRWSNDVKYRELFHNQFGRGDNTKEQYWEFKCQSKKQKNQN